MLQHYDVPLLKLEYCDYFSQLNVMSCEMMRFTLLTYLQHVAHFTKVLLSTEKAVNLQSTGVGHNRRHPRQN